MGLTIEKIGDNYINVNSIDRREKQKWREKKNLHEKSLYGKVYIKKFILKSLYQSFQKFIKMKHCIYSHQDYQLPKLSQYPQD